MSEEIKRRFLIVCDGGNVRSHALAYCLKWDHQQEAIAVGRIYMSRDTMHLLSEWADVIVIVQPHMEESIPISERDKLVCLDMGTDRWGYKFDGDLLKKAQAGADWVMAGCP